MRIYLDSSLTLKKAASRVRGDRLVKLIDLCETQQTISTRKLTTLVNELAASDRQDGIHFKALAEFLREYGR